MLESLPWKKLILLIVSRETCWGIKYPKDKNEWKKRGNFGLTAIKSKEEIFLGKRGTDAQRAHIGVGLVQLGYWQGQRERAESKKSLKLKTQAARRSWMLPKTCLPHRKVLPQAEKTEVGKCTQDWLYFSRQEILKQRAMLVTSAVQVRCVYAGATLT